MSTLYAIGKDIIGTQYSPNPNSNSVSVVADGVKTYATLLNELYALVDESRVTKDSVLKLDVNYLRAGDITNNLRFYCVVAISTTQMNVEYAVLRSNSAFRGANVNASSTTFTDYGSSVPSSGVTIELYYNDQPSYTTSMLADNVKYDNTQSGLSATDVQSAVDALTAPREYVRVIADGNTSFRNIFNSLFALVNVNKLSYDSKLVNSKDNTINVNVYTITQFTSSQIRLSAARGDDGGVVCEEAILNAETSTYTRSEGATKADWANAKPSSSSIFTLYY